jgi:hypothetical protein
MRKGTKRKKEKDVKNKRRIRKRRKTKDWRMKRKQKMNVKKELNRIGVPICHFYTWRFLSEQVEHSAMKKYGGV